MLAGTKSRRLDPKVLKAEQAVGGTVITPTLQTPPEKVVRSKRPLDPETVAVSVDPVRVYNELLTGLFLGRPPRRLDRLENAAEVSKYYLSIADTLKGSTDIDGYYRFAQAGAFLKKYEDMPPANIQAAEKATVERWYACERKNREKNRELWAKATRPYTYANDPCMSLIQKVRAEITSLIGEYPPQFADVSRFGRFGPGVSLSHSQRDLDPMLKSINPTALLSQRPEVEWLMRYTLFGEVIFESRYQAGASRASLPLDMVVEGALDGVEWVEHERLSTVPKDVERRRSIGVGGSLATWIQQSYDGWFRNRLCDWGLDLSDQDPNRSLAYLGSVMEPGDLRPCTIDLTDASSRICFGLVALVVSKPWARLLVRQRAKFCIVGDKRETLEMFSAMGNALTFSLQTLIFGAVVRSVLRDQALRNAKWRVYGDDIIVPEKAYDAVVAALELLGFEPNKLKSYKEGHFRESCGADYLRGTKVRPLFLKQPITDVCELYKVLNLVAAFAAESPIPALSYRRVYKYLLSKVPKGMKILGEPSEVLDRYVWAPVRKFPAVVVGRVDISHTPPERWAYWRCLLVRSNGDSHVREGRGFYDPDLLWKRVRVSGNRPGIIQGGEWRWLRFSQYRAITRLRGLERALLALYV